MKFLSVISLLLFLKAFPQEMPWVDNWDLEQYEKGREFVKKNQLTKGFMLYSDLYTMIPKTKYGIMAAKQMDSIIPIIRSRITQNLEGRWILRSQGSNWGINKADSDTLEVLEINREKISFKTLVSGIEKNINVHDLNFNDDHKFMEGGFDILYPNGELWTYEVSDDRLHLTHSGDKGKKGRSYIVCGNTEMYYERFKE